MKESNLEKLRIFISKQTAWDSLISEKMKLKSLHLEKSNLRMHLEIPVIKEWTNDNGFIMNAALDAILDTAGSFFAHALDDRKSIMTDISTSYLGTAKLGEILNIECYCPKIGRNLGFANLKIVCKDNTILLGKMIFFLQSNTNWAEKL